MVSQQTSADAAEGAAAAAGNSIEREDGTVTPGHPAPSITVPELPWKEPVTEKAEKTYTAEEVAAMLAAVQHPSEAAQGPPAPTPVYRPRMFEAQPEAARFDTEDWKNYALDLIDHLLRELRSRGMHLNAGPYMAGNNFLAGNGRARHS